MQLVNKAKENVHLPDQLPPSLLPFKIRHNTVPPTAVATTTAFLITNAPPGMVGIGRAYPVNLAILADSTKPWVVSFEEKSKSDITFNQLDTDKDGFVTGLELKDVFLKTGLSQNILANIW
jgi:epidermal growth factor receptor substrate 15